MAEDPSKKKQADKSLEAAGKAEEKANAEKRERGEKLLLENVRAKKKILERPLLEGIRRSKKSAVPEAPSERDIIPAGEDIGIDVARPSRIPADVHTGSIHDMHGGSFHDMQGGGLQDSHDTSDVAHDLSQEASAVDTAASDSGGGHHLSGLNQPGKQPIMLHGNTIGDVMKEAVLRSWDDHLKEKGKKKGATLSDLSHRRWIFEGLGQILNRRMFDDLRVIEERSATRLSDIRRLNLAKERGGLTDEERQELRMKEDEEAHRYWLRERFIRKVPLLKQEKIQWLEPLGEGAFGAKPYTVVSSWDLLAPGAKRAARWHYDNNLLRWQNAMVAYLPKKPKNTWFSGKAAKNGVESLFFDEAEERAYEKKFVEQYKKWLSNIESAEAELVAYDKFSADEEKRIQSQFK